jgi:hypothetical protein
VYRRAAGTALTAGARFLRRGAVALSLWLAAVAPAWAAEHQQRLLIAPHATDGRLAADEAPHLVVYDPAVTSPQPLLIWLAGTNGHPATGPAKFFATVLQQGYRLVGVSYVTADAVSQVCTQRRVVQQPRCAEQFRQQRVWGDSDAVVIQDRHEDAIVPRLVKLLQNLVEADPAGQWAQYLGGSEPRWDRIVLAGQSQGGGMAAYLAQSRAVAGVLMFSGGWDHGRDGGIAGWYKRPSQTPPQRWHATFHVDEPQAATMATIYRSLGLPAEHIHALDLPVAGRMAHTEGIGNIAYQPLWQQMLQPQ